MAFLKGEDSLSMALNESRLKLLVRLRRKWLNFKELLSPLIQNISLLSNTIYKEDFNGFRIKLMTFGVQSTLYQKRKKNFLMTEKVEHIF